MLQSSTSGAEFIKRHIGPNDADTKKMLESIGAGSLNDLIEKTVPASIRLKKPMNIPAALTEFELLESLKAIGSKNVIATNCIGTDVY